MSLMLEQDITRLRSVFASIRDAVFIADTNGVIIMANAASEILTGVLPDDLVGKKLQDSLIIENKKTDVSAFVRDALNGDRAVELAYDSTLRKSDGSLIPIGATATPMYAQDGAFTEIIIVARDLSAEMKLKQRQYEFISFAAHQLRQPFTSMRLGLDAIDDPTIPLDPSRKEMVNELRQIVMRFLNFIKELMEVARLEEGRIEIKKEVVDIRRITESILGELKGLAMSQNVEIHLFPNTSLTDSLLIFCDPERFCDILRNLMGNAVRYNQPRGTVTIDAHTVTLDMLNERLGSAHDALITLQNLRIKNPPESAWILITVADTGMGIPQDQQSRIFGSFFRAKNVIIKGLQGTGLGLSITKSLTEIMGGHIVFSSIENIGTTFYLVFPAYTGPDKK